MVNICKEAERHYVDEIVEVFKEISEITQGVGYRMRIMDLKEWGVLKPNWMLVDRQRGA